MREVVIAIPTFRRPAALRRALEEVALQVGELNADAPEGVRATVLVVDNDPAQSARDLAGQLGVGYVAEPEPGIAAVRNRAMAECATASGVIFIDDDEVPEPHWLRRLLERQSETAATAVAGRVITRFPPEVEPWVAASGAFIRPARRDGQAMSEAASNNLLLDVAQVQNLELSFDPRFGLTGGSDSLYTRALTARGGTIRWAEHAVVIEQEDAARFTRAWVLMRTFRFGNTAARVDVALAGSRRGRAAERMRMTARGGLRLLAGSARWLWGVARFSLRHRARGLRTAYRGAGMIAGAVGYAHDEYGRRRRRM